VASNPPALSNADFFTPSKGWLWITYTLAFTLLSSSDMTTRKIILLLSLFSLLIPVNALAATGAPKEPKPPCRLQITNAHLSTFIFEKQGLRALKVNASSICNVPQSSVTVTVELWKTGLLGNHLVRRRTFYSAGTTLPNSRVNNFLTFKRCKDRDPTQYFGIAYSKAFIAGRWQYARHTQTKKIIPLNCGT